MACCGKARKAFKENIARRNLVSSTPPVPSIPPTLPTPPTPSIPPTPSPSIPTVKPKFVKFSLSRRERKERIRRRAEKIKRRAERIAARQARKQKLINSVPTIQPVLPISQKDSSQNPPLSV